MITVEEALQIGRLKEATIKAGHSGLGRNVEGVTVMDIPDIANWLTGGELILAGVLFEQCFCKALIDALMEKGVAGIVTKEKFINSADPFLFTYCDGIGFPVILAPADCNWGQIMNPITSFMVSKPYLVIQESLNFHNAMMRSAINGYSLSELCAYMHETTELSFAIMDPDLHLIGFSSEFEWKTYTRNLTMGQIRYGGVSLESLEEGTVYLYTYTNLLLRSIARQILLYPITLNQVRYGYVLIAVNAEVTNLAPMDLVKVQQMALFVALHSTKVREITNATLRFNGLLLDRLLSEQNLTQEQAESILAPLGKKIHRNYYVVHLRYDQSDSIGSFIYRNSRISHFLSLVDKQLSQSDHVLSFERSLVHIFLIPSPSEQLDENLLQLRQLFIDTTGIKDLAIGVSDSMPLKGIRTALLQAEKTATYLLSCKSKKPFLRYRDLGLLKYFMDNSGALDEAYLGSTINRYITPILKYDELHQGQLMKTLELYFANNCSKIETANSLYIHKNTLRARLDTIGKLIDCDIDNMEDLFNIQMAMKIRSLSIS